MSVTLPARVAEQVERIARKRRLIDNRVLVELVEQGLEAQKEKEKATDGKPATERYGLRNVSPWHQEDAN